MLRRSRPPSAMSITRSPATVRFVPLRLQLGREDIAATLQKTLDEEGACDKKLTKIAESSVNVGAARS